MSLSPGLQYFVDHVHRLLFTVGAQLSLSSLAAALVISAGYLAWQRHQRGRRIRAATLLRALFPRWLRHQSIHVDFAYLFFNTFVFGLALGWAVLSYQFISNAIIGALVAVFGPASPSALPALVSRLGITFILFLSYELGYWVQHWICHKVPFMWEFHKVHHSAEVLTPVTVFRVHPVDSLLFANVLALFAAVGNGFGHYLFGDTAHQYVLSDTNLILVLFIHAYVHLQHSHMWIAFRGVLGRILLSPAHHQIHHSDDPKHFNRNLGSCLAVWDWLFGTLYVPEKEREKLSFGVDGHADPHTIKGELFTPFVEAAGHLKPARALDPLAAVERERA